MPCHAMPCHTIPYHIIPYHTIPYHTIPYHTIPYHTIPYHTISYHKTQTTIISSLLSLYYWIINFSHHALGVEEQHELPTFNTSFTTAPPPTTSSTPVSYPSASMVYPTSNYPPSPYNGFSNAYSGYPTLAHAHVPGAQYSPHYTTCSYPPQHNQPRFQANAVPANVTMNYGYHGSQVIADPSTPSSYVQ
jgi:hypothetical protein